MALRTMTFEVAVDNERAALAFDMRACLVDFLRRRIKDSISRAEDAEVDRETVLRRFALTYTATAKAYRLPRTLPTALVRWAAYVEINKGHDGFPQPTLGTVATFSREAVSSLPEGLLMVKLGGVMFVGRAPEGGIPEDLYETRVHKDDSTHKYIATFIAGRPDGADRVGIPDPVEPEGVNA